MTFSIFVIFLGVLVAAVTFFHYTQGLFSATISAILCIFAAVFAISYHETIVESLLGGAMADSAHAAVLMVLFAAIYLLLRTLFDKAIPGNVTLPAMADKIGGAAMGVVAGVFAAGLCAFAAQSMSFNPSILGYSRFKVEDREVSVPQSGGLRKMLRPAPDFLESDTPLNAQPTDLRQSLLLPADDILIDTVKRLSEQGALSTSKPLSEVHPDWLAELFGQRVGVQNSAKRVAMNLGAKKTEVFATPDGGHPDAGIYLFNKVVKRRNADFMHRGTDLTFPTTLPSGAPKQNFDQTMNIVFRVYFANTTKDGRDSLIRFSPSSIRLVTQKRSDAGGLEWTNYFPIGTLEDGVEFYSQRPDDFLFIDDSTETPGVTDKAVDLVFTIAREGFLQNAAKGTDPTTTKITPGTFLEVKRMARVDLSDQVILPTAKLKPGKAVSVMRKLQIKEPPKEIAAEVIVVTKPPAERIIGVWESNVDNVVSTMTANATTLTFVAGGPGGITITGPWRQTSASESSFVIQHAGKGSDGKDAADSITVSFENDDNCTVSGNKGESRNYVRKVGSSTPPATTPGTVKNPVTPMVLAAQDGSLNITEVQESRKFHDPISIPAGSAGDVQIAGGTVGVEELVLKSIKLPPTDPAKLKGAGEPINRLAVPAGSIMIQVTATPGPAAGGWSWKDKLGEIAAFDAAGTRYPLVGVWATVTNGSQILAQFNADGGALSLADFTPNGPPQQVWLAFYINEGTQIKQIKIGDAVLKTFDPPVP